MISGYSKLKRTFLHMMLEQGLTRIHIAPQTEGVCLPEHLMTAELVPLNLSYRFQVPVFDIDDWGIRVELSFSQQPFLCEIPWNCITSLQGTELCFDTSVLPEPIFYQFITEMSDTELIEGLKELFR